MNGPDEVVRRRRLDGPAERELARIIEAGVFARECLRDGRRPCGASTEELEIVVAQGDEALAEFVEANLGMVAALVKRWRHHVAGDYEDLFNDGRVGLLEAIARYDHTLGWRFSTFAWRVVSQRIAQDAVGARSCGMETIARARVAARIERSRAEHSTRLGHRVDDTELAGLLGRRVSSLRAAATPVRVDIELHELGDRVHGESDDTADLSWLKQMPPDERQVLVLHYGLGGDEPMTLVELSELLGLSPSGIYRLKRRALRRGRALAEDRAA